MKKILFASILSVLLLCYSGILFAGTDFYKNNVLSAFHVLIPGTHVSLVPPNGGVLSNIFSGFELPNRGKIQISEIAGTSYKESEGTLTREGVESLNILFKDKSKVHFSGSQGTLVSGTSTSDSSTGVFLLVLGNDRITVDIYGFYNVGDKAAEAAVRDSLLSCVFNPASVKNTSDTYSISTAGTSFKFADEIGSTRYFTIGGNPYDDAAGVLYTSTTADDRVPQSAWMTYASSAIDKFLSGYPEHTIISTRSVSFGGLQGFESIAEFAGMSKRVRTASGASVNRQKNGKAYQVLLFDDEEGKIYIFSGIALIDVDANVSQFGRITSTFVRSQ
jgi:hypothetical protein